MLWLAGVSARLRALAISAGFALAGASGAHAQRFEFFDGGPFPPRALAPDAREWDGPSPRLFVRRALEAQGYQVIALQRGGRVFEAQVEDRRGRRLRVIVDARDGQVIERFPLRGGFEGPPRPPRNVGPDRFERIGPPFEGPDVGALAPMPDDPRLAPNARQESMRQETMSQETLRQETARQDARKAGRKPAPRQARKPAGEQARKPAGDQARMQAARAAPATQTPAPSAAPPSSPDPARESARESAIAPAQPEGGASAAPSRNAILRRPDAPQRAAPPPRPDGAGSNEAGDASAQRSESAPARPAPRVVYPGPAGPSSANP